MKILVNENFKHLIEGASDRQKIWLSFWSHVYNKTSCQDYLSLHPKDYQFMLGLSEVAYDMNIADYGGQENLTARRHLGDAIAEEFQWRFENRHNILWRSRTLASKHKNGKGARAFYPTVETEITDVKAINMWCYLLGRLMAGNFLSGFSWRDQGYYQIDDLQLEAMGQKPRGYHFK